jgi:hypothetical protein
MVRYGTSKPFNFSIVLGVLLDLAYRAFEFFGVFRPGERRPKLPNEIIDWRRWPQEFIDRPAIQARHREEFVRTDPTFALLKSHKRRSRHSQLSRDRLLRQPPVAARVLQASR